jgi:4-hydroxy-3-polyprenylbenzoate decarboxylase
MRLIVGITGATGAPLGVALLQALREVNHQCRQDGRESMVESYLVLTRWARTTIQLETPYTVGEVSAMADHHFGPDEQTAPISSGSFRTDGMVIIPCSMKSLAGIRSGYAEGLLGRAADVVLKERRRLVLVPRETPLSEIHLENMLALARMGAHVVPPMPAFYNRPESVENIIDHTIARVLDQFGLPAPRACRWAGLPKSNSEVNSYER